MNHLKLHYPSAIEWMWDYCIYLGPFTDSDGDNYDLGVHLKGTFGPSAAIVWGNEPGEYSSGPLCMMGDDTLETHVELLKRAKSLGII